MTLARDVQREMLDELTPDDPRAQHSRRDLRTINAFMRHAATMTGALLGAWERRPPATLVELGAGDGTGLLRIARRVAPRWQPVHALLVDRQRLLSPETTAEFEALSWHVEAVEADVLEWLRASREPRADVTLANLFLHHFRAADLKTILHTCARRTRHFVACEPRRSRTGLAGAALLRFIGCNGVTRHDADLSVRAGFRDRELSAYWPREDGWRVTERRAGPFTHFFMATHADVV